MAIRIRTVDGIRVALCAVETDPKPGDIYLDDVDDRALRIKFARDWRREAAHMKGGAEALLSIEYPAEYRAMDSQKVRDAEEDVRRWDAANDRMLLVEFSDGGAFCLMSRSAAIRYGDVQLKKAQEAGTKFPCLGAYYALNFSADKAADFRAMTPDRMVEAVRGLPWSAELVVWFMRRDDCCRDTFALIERADERREFVREVMGLYTEADWAAVRVSIVDA